MWPLMQPAVPVAENTTAGRSRPPGSEPSQTKEQKGGKKKPRQHYKATEEDTLFLLAELQLFHHVFLFKSTE